MVLIKSFEGFRPRAVQEEDGRWVIGYGHTASAHEGLTVAEADAELLLQYDLMPVVKALNEQVSCPLNQHQFDALASFAVSVGVSRFMASDVLQRLNEGRAGQAADALIGWPEDVSAESRLRRRAAERALFVADPGSAVTLAELLAAPLPPPPVEPPAEPTPAPETIEPAAEVRAAAVAALLGEAPEPPVAPSEPAAVTAAPDAPDPSWAPEPPAFESPAFRPADAVTRVSLDRYSPYAAAIIGPLPGFASAPPAEEPRPAAATQAPAEVIRTAEPAPAASPTPAEPVAPTEAAEAAAPEEPAAPAEPSESAAPVAPLVPPAAPVASPFPPMDQDLVLTPATEADFVETERPVWPSEQRAAAPAEETILFEDEPTLSVLRHEVEPAGPRRFDWSETGAFLIMGVTGLASCAASAAAFRLSVEQPSDMGETTVIAWALALIGVICVGVSSWNLYVRWGKPD